MIKRLIFIVVIAIIFTSCSEDNKSKLKRLKEKRDELTVQINALEEILAGEKTETTEKLVCINVEKVQPGVFKHFMEAQGTVESDNNILIPAETPAVVQKIHVKKGDKISKGQLLAELDAIIINRGIDELRTQLDLASTVFERQKRLWNQKIGSEIQYLQTKANKETLDRKIKTLQEQLLKTKIFSPIKGSIDEIFIKESEMAFAGMGAIRVVELSKLKINAELSESYISQVKKDDIVKVYLPIIEKSLELSINSVSQVINPDNRTFSVEIFIPEQEKDIKPNMLSVLTINDYTNNNALVVPLNIVQKTGEENFLFVAKQNNKKWFAEKRIIKTGKNYNNKIEILSGMSPNEFVVVMGYQDLTNGQGIEVKEY